MKIKLGISIVLVMVFGLVGCDSLPPFERYKLVPNPFYENNSLHGQYKHVLLDTRSGDLFEIAFDDKDLTPTGYATIFRWRLLASGFRPAYTPVPHEQ